jgi:hypothetical protein
MGAVSDLLDWCDTLQRRNPVWTGFVTMARQLVMDADLSTLEALCQTDQPVQSVDEWERDAMAANALPEPARAVRQGTAMWAV